MPDQTRTTRRGLLGYAGAGGLGLAAGAIAATQLETPAEAGPQRIEVA